MYIPAVNSEEIAAAVEGMERRENDVVVIMLGEKNRPDIERLISLLDEKDIDFFGGIFPGIIHGTQRYEEGAVVAALPALEKPFVVKGLDSEDIEIPDFWADVIEGPGSRYTAMILVDGLTSNIALFLEEMFNTLGDAVNYFGGGAGSLSLQQEPCLFNREGFFQDAAVVTFLKLESNLGVQHGWEEIMGPLVATKTRKNIISELNWKNAFEVYRATVEPDSGSELTSIRH